MSSPNEPGYPRAGDGPGGANGSVGGPLSHDGLVRPGSGIAESGDVPPWQRGPAGAGGPAAAPSAAGAAGPRRDAAGGLGGGPLPRGRGTPG